MSRRADPVRVAFATCAAYPQGSPDDRLVLDRLAARGVQAVPAIWDSPEVHWGRFDLIVLRSTWDYFERPAEFLAWVDRVARVAPLWNPPRAVRWNAHKSYLEDLGARGIRVAPTELVRRGGAPDLAEILERRGWSAAVLKPAVGGNAYRLSRASRGDLAPARAALASLLREGDALVQPFLGRARELGERSIVFLDGTFSHAVSYRSVLEQNPRRPQPFRPTPAEIEAAARAVAVLDDVPLYARMDYLPDDDGAWLLGELEVIEPELFFATSATGTERFAEACLRRARSG